VPFATRIRLEPSFPTVVVGLITEPGIIRSGQANLIMLGRVLLRKPYGPLHAVCVLGKEAAPPIQYGRARD
jgi:hypothetical protein